MSEGTILKKECKDCRFSHWWGADRVEVCTNCVSSGKLPREKCFTEVTAENIQDSQAGDYFALNGYKFNVVRTHYVAKPELEEPSKHHVLEMT